MTEPVSGTAGRRSGPVARAAKRTMDVGLAAAAALAFAPVMALVAVAVRVTMGSPVLFRQVRPGLHGEPFVLLKFRTMGPPETDDPEAEEDFASRLTPVGRWLRTSSLDELPQLANVVRGELSLVGPRPLLPEYLPLYDATQRRRHEVRPGLTGLAQVVGRSSMKMEERFRLDVWYVDHHTLALDFSILVRTVRCVLSRDGMGRDGVPTEPSWSGNASTADVPLPRPTPEQQQTPDGRFGRPEAVNVAPTTRSAG